MRNQEKKQINPPMKTKKPRDLTPQATDKSDQQRIVSRQLYPQQVQKD